MNFRALERSVWVLEKSWNSPGNLFLKKGTNPVNHKGTRMVKDGYMDMDIAPFEMSLGYKFVVKSP